MGAKKKPGKQRHPARDASRLAYLESGGAVTNGELAERFGVSNRNITRWKCDDNWAAELKKQQPKRKRGGQPGNRNAKGAGAPVGNKNAVTHGAYAVVDYSKLSEKEREFIENIPKDANPEALTLASLQALYAKKFDLERRIGEYKAANENTLYIDKVIEMRKPADPGTARDLPELVALDGTELSVKTIIKASPSERIRPLEEQLNKVDKLIQTALKSLQGINEAQQRRDAEDRRYWLDVARATGRYRFDPDTGQLVGLLPTGQEDGEDWEAD